MATPSSTSATGQLDIEGSAIEEVTLARRIGHGDDFDFSNPLILRRPGSSVSIPAGEYFLQRIKLEGGFCCDVPFRIMGPADQVLKEPE